MKLKYTTIFKRFKIMKTNQKLKNTAKVGNKQIQNAPNLKTF